MKIKSIYIKNFFSIQEIKLDLETTGIISIEGKNKDTGGGNGAGKSSIYEAIVWGLFGRTIRKSVQDSLVNNKAKKECEVSLVLADGTEIKRVVKPPYLHIKIGDKTHIKESYQDTQKFIEDQLGINYKSFLVANVFGQQNELDFISATLEDKRIMLKTFLGLEEFFSLRDKFKTKKTDVSNKIKSIEYTLESNNTIITKAEKSIADSQKSIAAIKQKYNLTTNYDLVSILKVESEVKELSSKLTKTKSAREDAEKESTLLAKKLNSKARTCDSCNSTLNPLTKKEREELKELIECIRVTNLILDKDIKDLTDKIESLNKSIPISSAEYHKIEGIQTLEDSVKLNRKLVTEHTELVRQEMQKKESQVKYLEILKFWENVFSENGIVKYVVHNVLQHFNDRCMYYLSILTNGKAVIKFDDSFQESIIINGVPTYYHSLSGGERKKINFAVLLALQSLLDFTSKAKFDAILLDEVVESIDDESISNFYSLLTELAKSKAVYIISHNNTLKDLLVNHPKIKLVKSKGITKLA